MKFIKSELQLSSQVHERAYLLGVSIAAKLHNSRALRICALGLTTASLIGALAACSPQTPEEKIAAYSKTLGSQGELTPTHFILHWPARPVNFAPITLKIPLQYLDNPPAHKDDAGGIRWLYLRFPTKEAENIKSPPEVVTPENLAARVEYMESRLRSRVLVTLDRDSRGTGSRGYRDGTRKQVSDTQYHMRDGMVADLDRYSNLRCINTGDRPDPFMDEKVKNKPADDHSPSNCWLDRNSISLVSPVEVTADNEGVSMSCSLVNCTVYFSAGDGVGASSSILYSDVPRWKEIIEPVRELIGGFVVLKPVGASSSAGATPAKPISAK